MATPATRGMRGAGLTLRGRALTRARAVPRDKTVSWRRPALMSGASRRRAERFVLIAGAARTFGRARLMPRLFAGFFFFAADFFDDWVAAAFLTADFFLVLRPAALVFFFLGLVVIRIVVSAGRAERPIGYRVRVRTR